MKPSSLRRAGSVVVISSLALATPLMSATAKTSAPAGSGLRFRLGPLPAANPHSEALALRLSRAQKADQSVIVIFKNQYSGLETQVKHALKIRDTAIAGSQRSLAREMKLSGATHMTRFHIINAISAKVTRAEIRYLRAQPVVRAVVPNMRIALPKPAVLNADAGRAKVAARESLDAGHGGSHGCSVKKPLLEPEALGQIDAQFQNPKKPGQAAALATGKGVNVGIMADGIDVNNPDFIRANGSRVFTDVKDFSGAGYLLPGGNTEGMLDASSIGAQGNVSYPIGQFTSSLDPAYKAKSECPFIRVVGDAPGANLFVLQVNGAYTTTSSYIQAMQYAESSGVNVLSQTFGENFYPDLTDDPVALADRAAIASGITVVASSGDAGVNGSNSSPATPPGVIGTGATTSFQIYKQLGDSGFQFSDGKYVDDQISSLSSGGSTQTGAKSIDVVAPGDLNWSLCDEGDPSCVTDSGFPAGVAEEGGTSESAPLVAGVAALVIQKYRSTHHGATPSPAVVKEIIMSSATNLGLPSSYQGAGLVDAYKAVQMAASWRRAPAHHVGDTLSVDSGGCLSAAANQCDMALAAAGQPGTRNSFSFSVTNQGKNPERVHLKATKLVGLAASVVNTTFTRDADPTFVDQYGQTRRYQTYTYHVGGGHAELDAQLAWDNNADPNTLLRLTLISPSGAYAGFSFPQGIGNGFGRVIVRAPMAGAWKEIVWTHSGTTGYTGPIQLSNQLFVKKNAGSITPSAAMIQPGGTLRFRYQVRTPALAGDGIAEVNVVGTAGGKKAVNMTIPVVLRSLIPTDAAHGGSWSGTIIGGNGRAQNANEEIANAQTFEFSVPAGRRELSLHIHLPDPSQQDDISGVLTDPSGTPVDDQSDITNTSADGNGLLYDDDLQFYHVNPVPGVWMLTLELDFYSSPVASEPFTGSISFQPVDATPSGLSDSLSTDLSQGTPHVASISVTNTTNVVESYYLDPRLNSYSAYDLGGADNGANSPFVEQSFLVPPETNMLQASVGNFTDSTPVSLEIGNANGVLPGDENATPDLWQAGTPGEPTTLTYDADNVPNGFWLLLGSDVDCPSMCQGQLPEFDDLASDVQVRSKTVDTDITSDTGDLWQFYLGASNSFDYEPLVLAPGASGTINLTITPSQAVGAVVSGDIYLDTTQFIPPGCDAASCAFFTTGSTDELAAIPYAYTVGS